MHMRPTPSSYRTSQGIWGGQNRFEKESSFCIHCGLCIRYCNEVKKANAIGFVDRGIRKEISFIQT